MSNLFGHRFQASNFSLLSPVWVPAPLMATMTAGVDLVTGTCVCPVPYPYYQVLGVMGTINVTTAYNSTATLRLQAVKPSSGAVSTTPFTCDMAGVPVNAISRVHFRMLSLELGKHANKQSGYIVTAPGTTGTKFTNVDTSITGKNVVSTNDTTNVASAYREWLPELIWTENLTTGVATVNAAFLIKPISMHTSPAA